MESKDDDEEEGEAKGILPPLNNISWEIYFDQYKKIPQFKLINSDMTLSEFKVIFYWEYFHRILARLIGLFFLIPLLFFFISKKINWSNKSDNILEISNEVGLGLKNILFIDDILEREHKHANEYQQRSAVVVGLFFRKNKPFNIAKMG